MINDKTDAIEYIVRVLEQKCDWRKALVAKFPEDQRNERAADRLDELAVEAAGMTDEQFASLKPYFGWASVTFRDATSQVAREVGFKTRAKDFDTFVKVLVHQLAFERCRVSRIEILMSFYDRDPTVPYWRSNVCVDSLFTAHAHRPDRAQAWLRHKKVSEDCSGFGQAVLMRGHFEGGILSNHTYHWTFTPGRVGELAIVVPVFRDCRLVDLAAFSRHDHAVWGCTTGAATYLGDIATPLRIHRTLADWLANDCVGVLPLSKAFFPLLQNAPRIIAEDDDHAWDLAYRVFIDPAAAFGADQDAAEERSFTRIEVAA